MINLEPLCWSALIQLSTVVNDKQHLSSLKLPGHWFEYLFLGVVLQLNEEAHSLYSELIENFTNSYYLKGQQAQPAQSGRCDSDIAGYSSRVISTSLTSTVMCSTWKDCAPIWTLWLTPPIRSIRFVEICCCIANYYTLPVQHNNAIVYFKRTLQLKPSHLSAWTLRGHVCSSSVVHTSSYLSYFGLFRLSSWIQIV